MWLSSKFSGLIISPLCSTLVFAATAPPYATTAGGTTYSSTATGAWSAGGWVGGGGGGGGGGAGAGAGASSGYLSSSFFSSIGYYAIYSGGCSAFSGGFTSY